MKTIDDICALVEQFFADETCAAHAITIYFQRDNQKPEDGDSHGARAWCASSACPFLTRIDCGAPVTNTAYEEAVQFEIVPTADIQHLQLTTSNKSIGNIIKLGEGKQAKELMEAKGVVFKQ